MSSATQGEARVAGFSLARSQRSGVVWQASQIGLRPGLAGLLLIAVADNFILQLGTGLFDQLLIVSHRLAGRLQRRRCVLLHQFGLALQLRRPRLPQASASAACSACVSRAFTFCASASAVCSSATVASYSTSFDFHLKPAKLPSSNPALTRMPFSFCGNSRKTANSAITASIAQQHHEVFQE